MDEESVGDGTKVPTDEGPIIWRRPSKAGLVLSAVSFAAALVPSLLPRPLMFLLLLTTVGAVLGYAFGTFVGWLARKIRWVRRHQGPPWAGWLIAGVAWLAALAFTPISVGWQAEQQSALDMPSALPSSIVLVLATAISATLLLALGRALRLATRSIAAQICRIPLLARRLADARDLGALARALRALDDSRQGGRAPGVHVGPHGNDHERFRENRAPGDRGRHGGAVLAVSRFLPVLRVLRAGERRRTRHRQGGGGAGHDREPGEATHAGTISAAATGSRASRGNSPQPQVAAGRSPRHIAIKSSREIGLRWNPSQPARSARSRSMLSAAAVSATIRPA